MIVAVASVDESRCTGCGTCGRFCQYHARARLAGARVAGRIRYDRSVTLAQMQERAVVEIDAPCAADIHHIWQQLGL